MKFAFEMGIIKEKDVRIKCLLFQYLVIRGLMKIQSDFLVKVSMFVKKS